MDQVYGLHCLPLHVYTLVQYLCSLPNSFVLKQCTNLFVLHKSSNTQSTPLILKMRFRHDIASKAVFFSLVTSLTHLLGGFQLLYHHIFTVLPCVSFTWAALPFYVVGKFALQTGSSQLQAGCSQLQAGFSQLQARFSQLQAWCSQLQAGCRQLQAGSSQLQAGCSQLQAGCIQLQAGFSQLQAVYPATGRV